MSEEEAMRQRLDWLKRRDPNTLRWFERNELSELERERLTRMMSRLRLHRPPLQKESAMSSAEIYFTEFTMPDGTKRRPLFERCEAMRPTIGYARKRIPIELRMDSIGYVAAGAGILGGDRFFSFGDDEALALCRCQVEDWLLERKFYVEKRMDGSFNVWDVQDGSIADGPTIHHALIAAANAVLDSQEQTK